MVRIPTRDSFNTTISDTAGGARFSAGAISADAATRGSRELQATGRAVRESSAVVTGISTDIVNDINKSLVLNAANDLLRHKQQLSTGEQGYAKLSGDSAINRPDGMDLVSEYSGKLKEYGSQIESGLKNDAQRQMFQQFFAKEQLGFEDELGRHMASEQKRFDISSGNGAVDMGTQSAVLAFREPKKIQDAIGFAKQGIMLSSKAQGLAPLEVEAKTREVESKIHAAVVQSALETNDTEYALKYYNTYRSGLQANEIMKLEPIIQDHRAGVDAKNATSAATQKYKGSFFPTEQDRLYNLAGPVNMEKLAASVAVSESGAREYDANGKRITSPVGARGIMQVMPATARDPGYGIEPSDGTPAGDKRVGDQLLARHVKHYGRLDYALAAYNAGPVHVDRAIEKAKAAGTNDWMQFLPKKEETIPYVQKTLKHYTAGLGAPPLPSRLEFVADAVSQVPESSAQKTREAAERQYDEMIKAREQQIGTLFGNVQKALIENGGHKNLLPVEMVSSLLALDPAKQTAVDEFASSIKKGLSVETNPEAQYNLIMKPDVFLYEDVKTPTGMRRRELSDSETYALVVNNFAPSERDNALEKLARVRSGEDSTSSTSLDDTTFKNILSSRLASMGINPAPKTSDKDANQTLWKVTKFVSDEVYRIQRETRKKLSPKELEQTIDDIFTTSVEYKPPGFGTWLTEIYNALPRGNAPDLPTTLMNPLISTGGTGVPNEMRRQILRDFAAKGMSQPTEFDIMQVYLRNEYRKSNLYSGGGKKDGK